MIVIEKVGAGVSVTIERAYPLVCHHIGTVNRRGLSELYSSATSAVASAHAIIV